MARTRLPTSYGTFDTYGYRSSLDGTEHLALVFGAVAESSESTESTDASDTDGTLVRLHSECLTGEAFGSLRCDCGPQLQAAMQTIAAAGAGVVVYLRGHEGRGIGLLPKLATYALQDDGHDTVAANVALGFPTDARDYSVGAFILADLGVKRVRLLTNNPAKVSGLERNGLMVVGREPLLVEPNPANARYLRAKRERLGHLL